MTDLVEVESITVRFGERDYEIKTPSFMITPVWKQKVFEQVKPLFEQASGVKDLKFDTAADLLKLYPIVKDVFIDGIGQIYPLVMEFSPELEADRAYIEAHATEKQILSAFQEALKLADPFGAISLMMRMFGRQMIGTS